MVVVVGITVAGCYKVQPLPLQTLPFAQPNTQLYELSFSAQRSEAAYLSPFRPPDRHALEQIGLLCHVHR